MSMLKNKLKDDKFAAVRGGEKKKAAVVGFMYSEVTTREKNELRELSDEEVVKMIFAAIKIATENLENAKQIKDEKNIAEYTTEIEILKTYLPDQLSEEEAKAIITRLITENGFTSMKDMGKLKPLIDAEINGRFDGKSVGNIARDMLQKKA